jgi:hypothetical protein
MTIESASWRGAQLRLQRLKNVDSAKRHPGHGHFWDRAFSRRQFIQATTAAGGIYLGSKYASAAAALPGDTPKAIPGIVFGPGTFTDINDDRSTITDFNGHVGYAAAGGIGLGRTGGSGPFSPFSWEVDLRFMQGAYRGLDGKTRYGTFCLI